VSDPLRVLLLNHADVGAGGAAVAGFRLHRSLLTAGVDSTLLVGAKASSEPTVHQLAHPRLLRRALRKVGHEVGLNELAGVGAYGLAGSELTRRADVVHAHAVHGDWFSYPALAGLSRRAPTVLTLHDMWPFTGHCSFSFECDRWQNGCGRCPHPEVFPAVKRDATAVEWRLKKAVWARSRMVVVTPSRWLARLAGQSTLGHLDVRVIPYGIDTADFSPRPREACRAALGIPEASVALLFTAASLASRPDGSPGIPLEPIDAGASDRKGTDLLLAALRGVPPELRPRCSLILMGGQGEAMTAALRADGYAVVDLGYVVSDPLKSFVYSAADLFVCPTRADNSPLVVLESLACGTPVATFDVGGLAEVVRPGQTGMVVPPADAAALTAEIVAALHDPGRLARLRPSCRSMIEAEHGSTLAAARHVELYEELLGAGRPGPDPG